MLSKIVCQSLNNNTKLYHTLVLLVLLGTTILLTTIKIK